MSDPKELSEAPASAPAEAEAVATAPAETAPAPAPEAALTAAAPEQPVAPPAAEGTLPAGQEGGPFVPDQSRAGARAEAAAPSQPEDPGGSAHEPAEDETLEQAADREGLAHLQGAAVRRVDPSEEPPRPAKRDKTPAGLWCDFLDGLGPLPSAADDARRQLVERLREQDERA